MEMINSYRILVDNCEGKRPLGRPRCRWYENMEMNVRQRGWEGVDRIHLAQDRDKWQVIMNTV
jgi:hypothetical protein